MNTNSMKKIALGILIITLFLSSYAQDINKNSTQKLKTAYDLRNDLNPKRLTIAMWDYSYLKMHYKGGAFEDYNKVTNELIERGFNAVRIDAFPLIIGSLKNPKEQITFKGNQWDTWGPTDIDRKHEILGELIDFMKITKEKKISVILSTWNESCIEYPDIRKNFKDQTKYLAAWSKVIDTLDKCQLLDHVVYIDLDQEFPYFSPFMDAIDSLGKIKDAEKIKMPENKRIIGYNDRNSDEFRWNRKQIDYTYNLMDSCLELFHIKYPKLRFTYSISEFWEEFRYMDLTSFDVLELHIWLTQSKRFMTRTQFDAQKKYRGEEDYTDYNRRLKETMESIKPMLIKDMHNKLQYANAWADEIAVPLVTTEAWGPWWQMDSKTLDWDYLYEWCELGVQLSAEYGFWGTTPWNYSHPYWKNWSNIGWYKKVNNGFLKQ